MRYQLLYAIAWTVLPAALFATVAEDISEMFTKLKVELKFSLEAASAGSRAKRVWGAT